MKGTPHRLSKCLPAEARAEMHTASILHWDLAIFKPLMVEGLGTWIEAGAGECMVEIGAFWWAAVPILVLFLSRDLLNLPSCLSI